MKTSEGYERMFKVLRDMGREDIVLAIIESRKTRSNKGLLVEGTPEYEEAAKRLNEACSGADCYCMKDD